MSLLPADTPRLPKWPFLAGDAALLTVAFLIGHFARNPFAGAALIFIVASVALGAVLAAVPFITDYARKQDETLDERQRALEALARTVAASAEQISIAAAALNGLSEVSTRNLKLAEQFSARLQERAADTKPLEHAAEQIRKAIGDLSKLDTAAQKNLHAVRDAFHTKAEHLYEQLDARIAALTSLAEKLPANGHVAEADSGSRSSRLEEKPEPPAAPAKISHEPSESPVSAAQEEIESAVATLTIAEPPPAEEAPASKAPSPRKRAAKRPKPAEVPKSMLGLESESAPSQPTQENANAASEPAPSSDGATRLIVTSYIGIGNRLFLRGEGPGLSWDKGVPLQFISIGKWRWETSDAAAPIRAKLYKNDDVECATLGTLTVEPGSQAEVTAAF